MKPANRTILALLISLPIALGLGWLISAMVGDPNPPNGGWITGLVLWVLIVLLAGIWRLAGGTRTLGWLLAGTFLLRLVVGVGLERFLPVYGYPTSVEHQSGYFYTDAMRRDTTALALARSDKPLAAAFTEDFASDQYGGLLSFSAWVYRYLSPDGRRPHLVMMLGAAAGTAGLAFVWALTRKRWGYGPAITAGLMYALYPQSVILGATQMREPYLISAAAGTLWAMAAWHQTTREQGRRRLMIWGVLAASLLSMAFFSTRIAAITLAVTTGYFLVEAAAGAAAQNRRWRPFILAALVGGGMLTLALTWNWLRYSTLWDASLTQQQSGWVQQIFSLLPEQGQIPFIIGYGLAQPVLPATLSDLAMPLLLQPGDQALVDLAPALLRQVNFWLALGWYILLPVLIYSVFAAWRVQPRENRRLLIFLVLFMVAWALISSARAGGDQWDNPRYRTIFISWQSVLFAWGLYYARQTRDAWLGRAYLVAGIFVFFFTEWYVSRYTRLIGRPGFFTLIAAIAGSSLLVIVGGWLWDRRSRRAGLTIPPEKL